MKKIVTILASSLALVFGLAHADAPAVDDNLKFGYSPGTFFMGPSPIEYANGLGSLTALQDKKVEPIEIDVERIAKKNADSDKYVWWLTNNNNYLSLVLAFEKLYDKDVLQSNEDFDRDLAESSRLATSGDPGNDYASTHSRCQTILTASRQAKDFPHYWLCENLRASWRKNLPSDLIQSSVMIGASMAFTNNVLGVDLRNGDLENMFLFDEIHIGYAYLVLANAAHVAKYRHPLNQANAFLREDLKRQFGIKKNDANRVAENMAYDSDTQFGFVANIFAKSKVVETLKAPFFLKHEPFYYNELVTLVNVLSITNPNDIARKIRKEKRIAGKTEAEILAEIDQSATNEEAAYPRALKASKGDKLALEQLLSDANSGGVLSQNYLGMLYYGNDRGDLGVPQDYKEAAKWYRKAADQGNADAQLRIGSLYLNEKSGLPYSWVLSVQWVQKSANQGNIEAQRMLGDIYKVSHPGVPENRILGTAYSMASGYNVSHAGMGSLPPSWGTVEERTQTEALAWKFFKQQIR